MQHPLQLTLLNSGFFSNATCAVFSFQSPFCPPRTLWSFLSLCALTCVPYRPTPVNRSPQGGTDAIFPDDTSNLTAFFSLWPETEPLCFTAEFFFSPNIIRPSQSNSCFFPRLTFWPLDTFCHGWWHDSLVCLSFCVWWQSVALFLQILCPWVHRKPWRQSAPTCRNSMKTGNPGWVSSCFPAPPCSAALSYCDMLARMHQVQSVPLTQEVESTNASYYATWIVSPTGYWSNIVAHRSSKQFATLKVLTGCFTSISKDFLQILQIISLKL